MWTVVGAGGDDPCACSLCGAKGAALLRNGFDSRVLENLAVTNQVRFLGIGAQKAATTWLWQAFRRHPEIWMPPRKELHYFDRSTHYLSPSYLATDRLAGRLLGSEEHNKRFRKVLIRELSAAVAAGDTATFRWSMRYFFGTYNDDWYLSLFRDAVGKAVGEITPSYSMLDMPDVQKIQALFPNLRVLFLMRDPVDRAWSQYRFHQGQEGKQIAAISLRDVMAFMEWPGQRLRGDYNRTLAIWGACFPSEQLWFGYFEDVVEDPTGTLASALRFLEVDEKGERDDAKLGMRVNTSQQVEMPIEVRRYLSRLYVDDLRILGRRIGGRTLKWLESAESMV